MCREVGSIKKKIEFELKSYFAEDFKDFSIQEINSLKIKLIKLKSDLIIKGETDEISKEIYDVEKDILSRNKPNIWNINIEGNIEQKLEVDFMTYYVSVMSNLGFESREITTFDFYASIKYLKQKQKNV